MWESPIEILQEKIKLQMEGEVLKAVQKYGVNVNKEELLKALQYDRNQYEKGYQDGLAENKWIPCSERLPEESEYYMACIYDPEVDDFDFRKTWFAHVDDYDMEESEWRELYDFEKVTAWMPLPEPYKGEEHE